MKQRMRLLLISIIGAAVLLILLLLYLLFLSVAMDLVKQHGSGDIHQLTSRIYLANQSDNLQPQDYQYIARRYAAEQSIHIIIVDMDSNLLADTNQAGQLSGRYINANLSEAKEGRVVSSIVRSRSTGSLYISVGKIAVIGDREIIISCSYDIAVFNRLTTLYAIAVGVIMLLLVLMIILLTQLFLHRFRKPISNLLQHTRKAAETHGGYYKINIDTTNPELIQLVKEFNSLIDKYDLLINSDNEKYSKINSMLSHIRTGIMIVDKENNVSLINPRAEELLEVDKAHIFSNRPEEREHNRTLQFLLERTGLVNSDKRTRMESFTTATGLILDMSIEAMYSKYKPYDHSGSLVLIRDVTEIRRLEKLKDEFVSNVSHELRTPLTVINGFVQTLQAWDVLQPEDRMKSLTIIELETERLKKLISELLMLSRIEGEMDGSNILPFNVVAVLNEAVSSLQLVAEEKSITLISKYDSHVPLTLQGREIWFKQIATNLIDNAVKYSPADSEVEINLCQEDDTYLTLVVTDHGIGIPQDDIPRIFERFFRVEKSRNSKIAGSGLGLAITKMMIDEFDGEISVESELGKGTTISIRFPITTDNKDFTGVITD